MSHLVVSICVMPESQGGRRLLLQLLQLLLLLLLLLALILPPRDSVRGAGRMLAGRRGRRSKERSIPWPAAVVVLQQQWP